jgi:hypothetical protein
LIVTSGEILAIFVSSVFNFGHFWFPAFVLLPIFTPFCFGSCRVPQHFGGVYKQVAKIKHTRNENGQNFTHRNKTTLYWRKKAKINLHQNIRWTYFIVNNISKTHTTISETKLCKNCYLVLWLTHIDVGQKVGRRGRHHMVIGFTTTCAISAYYH